MDSVQYVTTSINHSGVLVSRTYLVQVELSDSSRVEGVLRYGHHDTDTSAICVVRHHLQRCLGNTEYVSARVTVRVKYLTITCNQLYNLL